MAVPSARRGLPPEIVSDHATDPGKIRISVDLVSAARSLLSFLRSLSTSPLLRHPAAIRRSIRRYEDLWMPLISDLSASSPPVLLPPPDVRWIWLCHSLSPRSYRDYCAARFGALLERPAVFDEETEEYASDRCRELWAARYPSEPFDPEATDAGGDEPATDRVADLLAVIESRRDLWERFRDPFLAESVQLVAARQRYLDFLHLCRRAAAGSRLAPASDVALMWTAHKSFPGAFWTDAEVNGMADLEDRIADDAASEVEMEETRRIWEEAYDEPCERAGGGFRPAETPSREFVYWEAPEFDVNRDYKALKPRFMMEVHVCLKGKWGDSRSCGNNERMFLRLHVLRSHKEMRHEMPVSSLHSASWQEVWQVCCEFATQGLILELRQRRGTGCLGGSKVVDRLVFQWIDILRTTSLSLLKELAGNWRALVSITAPVQAPYLLKSVPDRVTDDTGAMISDVILRMNAYHPQKGRWLSRTVLDQSRRECFVIRIRVAEGFWRRGAETPKAVKWEERIIEVRKGAWSYVAGSVGTSPSKVVGTATPEEEDRECKKIRWHLSTGHLLTVQFQNHLSYQLENVESSEQIMLVRGRKLQYEPKRSKSTDIQDEEDDHYATLLRVTSEYPDGKATALINWRLFAVEFLPDEDAVLVLLLCTSIVRSISGLTGKDVGSLLLRRRVKETKAGVRDWGSIMLPSSLPHLQPWFWNADQVLSSLEVNDVRQPSSWYSAADGKEEIYRQVVLGPFLSSASTQP